MEIFKVEYGNNLLQTIREKFLDAKVLFVTQKNLFDKYKSIISKDYDVIFIESMDKDYLDETFASLKDFDKVIGFGGGVSVDAAKYFAIAKEKPCILVPTAISVDACFSYPVAVRVNNKVKYVGKCIPETIFIDFDLIQSAPLTLNLSGVGDVLSCYTGLFDWALMYSEGKVQSINSKIKETAESYLNRLFSSHKDIREINDKAIMLIMDAYKWVGETSLLNGHCYYEEGSEHYFAYAFESVSKKQLLHGQLVCLGVYIMSKLQQEGRQHKVKSFLDNIGLSISYTSLGITKEEVIATLKILNSYAEEEKLSFSILNVKKITNEFIESVIAELDSFNGELND